VKAGAILPLYDKVKNLRSNNETLVFQVFPGEKGTFTLYEDQGNDKNYKTEFATTDLSSRREGQTLTIQIGSRMGSYKEMPKERTYKIKVAASGMPTSVTVNGKTASFDYDGENLTLMVTLPHVNCNEAQEIQITYPENVPVLTDGLLSQMKILKKTMTEMKYRDAGIDYIDGLGEMGSLGQALIYYPAEFNQRIQYFKDCYKNLPALLDKQKLKEEDKTWFLKSVNHKK